MSNDKSNIQSILIKYFLIEPPATAAEILDFSPAFPEAIVTAKYHRPITVDKACKQCLNFLPTLSLGRVPAKC